MTAMNLIQQWFGYGVHLTQTAWAYEQRGDPMTAANCYQQGLQAFATCGTLAGVQPIDRLYWIGVCSLRLGWISVAGRNPAWAEYWFGQARAALEDACRCDPGNRGYQDLLQRVPRPQPQPAQPAKPARSERKGGGLL